LAENRGLEAHQPNPLLKRLKASAEGRHKIKKKIILSIVIFLLIAYSKDSFAEIIYKKDGKAIDAKIVDVTSNTIWYEVAGGRSGLQKASVSKILNDDETISEYSPNYKKPEPTIVIANESEAVLIPKEPEYISESAPVIESESERILTPEPEPMPEPIDEGALFKSRLIAALEELTLTLEDLEKQYKNTRFEDDIVLIRNLKSFSAARKKEDLESPMIVVSKMYSFVSKYENDYLEDVTYANAKEYMKNLGIRPQVLSMPYEDIQLWMQGVHFYDAKLWTSTIDRFMDLKDRLDNTKYKSLLAEDIYPMLATAYVRLLESEKAYLLAKEGLDRFPGDKAFQKRMEAIVTEIKLEKGDIGSVIFKIMLGFGVMVLISAFILFVGTKIMSIEATIKDVLIISFFTSLASLIPIPGILSLILQYVVFLVAVNKLTSADLTEASSLALILVGIRFVIFTLILIRI